MTVKYMGYIRTRQIFCNWKGRGETDVRHEDPSRGINLNLVVGWCTLCTDIDQPSDELQLMFCWRSHQLGMIFLSRAH